MKRFILFVLSLLGCSLVGCEPMYGPAPMYGPIHAEYGENPIVDETLAQEGNTNLQNE